MDPVALFAELALDLDDRVRACASAPLEQRVGAVFVGLSGLIAHAPSLPLVRASAAPAVRVEPLVDWPGFGAYEDYWRPGGADGVPRPMRASETLAAICGQLGAGLGRYGRGDADGACAVWAGGFADAWGPAALELLGVLHPAVVAFQRDRAAPSRRRRAPASLVTLGTDAPRGAPEQRPEVAERATLGLRLEAIGGGAEVVAVHPAGPAAGVLRAGDVLLSVDGRPLDGLDVEAAGQALTGAVGSRRRYEVFRDGATTFVELVSAPLGALGG